jgi:hypothetical protein
VGEQRKRHLEEVARDTRIGATEEVRSAAAAELARARHEKTPKRERKRSARHAAKALWKDVPAAERAAEMRRRRALGVARKRARAKEYEKELAARIAAKELYGDE